MNVQFESDWRSQLDTKYADSAYNGLLPSATTDRLGRSLSNTFDSNFDDFDLENTKSKIYDSIRFPPCAKVNLPGPIDPQDYKEIPEPYVPKNGSIHSNDSIAGLDFLEALFQTVVEKAVDVRESIIENGSYVYGLGNPPADDDAEYMRTVLIENLTLLRDESLQLIKEMVIFQTDKVNDMIHPDIKTAKDLVMRRKTSLFRRTAQMKHEITESAIVVDSLIHYSNSIISFPTTAVCKIDGIHVDWTKLAKMQQRISSSNRSVNFSSYMIAKGFPVCGVIYKFLQSTKSYGNVIEICNYYFQPGELKTIFDFFTEQHNKKVASRTSDSDGKQKKSSLSILESIHQLILFNCGISDKDCHMLSSVFPLMKNLHTLSLKTNRITYSGISSFATAVFETGSLLKCLRLDDNNINTDGAHVLAEALHRLPYLEVLSVAGNPIGDKGLFYILKNCMNRYRRAFKELPQPTRRVPHSYASMLGSSEGSFTGLESVQDDDQALHLVDDVSVNDADEVHRKEKSRNVSRKFFHCYFDDYFALPLSEAEIAKINNDKMRERFDSDIDLESRWINHQDDEFYMEQISNYSDEVVSPEEQAALDEAAAKRAALAKAEILSKEEQVLLYPLLIQALLRVRVKLVAINAFLRFMRKGSMVSSLNLANCGLTSGVARTIVHVLSDDHNITSLDLSGNTHLLSNNESCNEIAKLFGKSALTSLKLNKCSVNDFGVMQLMKSAMLSNKVHTIELSDNYVGPTGANWLATAAKVFYVDTLELKSGFHKNVPFPNVKLNPDTHIGPDHQFFDDYDNEDVRYLSEYGSGTNGEEGDEDDPYEDTDLYTGEEGESGSSYYDEDEEYDDDDEEDADYEDDATEPTRDSELRRPEDEEEEEDAEIVTKRFSVL